MNLIAFLALMALTFASAWAADNTGGTRETLAQGYAALAQGQPTNAVALFRRVLAADPGNRSAKYGISAAYIRMDKFRESIAILNALIEQYPDDFVLKNNAAWLFATVQDPTHRDPARALSLAREALLLAPQHYSVWSTLAEAHYSSGDYERALKCAQEALRLAQEARVPAAKATEYQEQIRRCERALEAFSILE